jgi:hypothetical protein
VERDAVRVEGVDHDHVIAVVVPLQEPATVVHVDDDARAPRQLEPLVGGRDDLRVELDGRDLDVLEVAEEPLLRRAAAEADDEDPLRVGVVREPELEVVGVREPGAKRLADVHPTLERAVEAEGTAIPPVDDHETVVARVARLADS